MLFRLIVSLDNATYVYQLFADNQLPQQKYKFETIENKTGIAVVNGSQEMSVYAGITKTVGEVEIIHFDKGEQRLKIQAHKSAIISIALNNDGSLIATASQKGQVIRIFKTDNGQQLQELRRGSDQANINAIKFDIVSGHLTASSDKGTIHIFGVHRDFHLASRIESGNVPVVGLAEANVVRANGLYG